MPRPNKLSESDKIYIREHLEDSPESLSEATGKPENAVRAFIKTVVDQTARPDANNSVVPARSVKDAGFAASDPTDKLRRGIVISTKEASSKSDDFIKSPASKKHQELIERNPVVYIPNKGRPSF